MSDISFRLKQLLEKIGIKSDDNIYEKAELTAITNALEGLENELLIQEKCLFNPQSNEFFKNRCVQMETIPDCFTDEELQEKIDELFSCVCGVYDPLKFQQDTKLINIYDILNCENMHMIISGKKILERGIALRDIGWFFKQYLSPTVVSVAGGEGLTFDKWDSFNYRFADIDRFNIPIRFLETL